MSIKLRYSSEKFHHIKIVILHIINYFPLLYFKIRILSLDTVDMFCSQIYYIFFIIFDIKVSLSWNRNIIWKFKNSRSIRFEKFVWAAFCYLFFTPSLWKYHYYLTLFSVYHYSHSWCSWYDTSKYRVSNKKCDRTTADSPNQTETSKRIRLA